MSEESDHCYFGTAESSGDGDPICACTCGHCTRADLIATARAKGLLDDEDVVRAIEAYPNKSRRPN